MAATCSSGKIRAHGWQLISGDFAGMSVVDVMMDFAPSIASNTDFYLLNENEQPRQIAGISTSYTRFTQFLHIFNAFYTLECYTFFIPN